MEDEFIEYKNYTWPINDPDKIHILKKTICSFLNYKGGVLMFGVQDKIWKVRGIQLSSSDMDKFKLFVFDTLVTDFCPDLKRIDQELIRVDFFPIKN